MYTETKQINIADLNLDKENPRLPSYVLKEPEHIFKFLAESSSIEELISAIGANGYFDSEPLIAIEDEDGYTVVEGNRRLTALKLLSGEEHEGMSRKVTEAVSSASERPEVVAVAVYEYRDDILNYLGNKHIAGVKPWGALAKAKYAKQLYDRTDSSLSPIDRTREVAKSIGSRSDFITRSIKALEAYDYARSREFFGLDDVDEDTVKFSLLGTALDYSGIQQYVYEDTSEESDRNFIEGNLKNLFSWMFEKSNKNATRLGESRNLKMLSKVVISEDALKAFNQGLPLARAFVLTASYDDEFDTLTTNIHGMLMEANSLVADVNKTHDRAEKAKKISNQAKNLKSSCKING